MLFVNHKEGGNRISTTGLAVVPSRLAKQKKTEKRRRDGHRETGKRGKGTSDY